MFVKVIDENDVELYECVSVCLTHVEGPKVRFTLTDRSNEQTSLAVPGNGGTSVFYMNDEGKTIDRPVIAVS